MSHVAVRPFMMTLYDVTSTSADIRARRLSLEKRNTKKYRNKAMKTVTRAVTRRCAARSSGSIRSTQAEIQVGSGGFSRRSSPFMVGIK